MGSTQSTNSNLEHIKTKWRIRANLCSAKLPQKVFCIFTQSWLAIFLIFAWSQAESGFKFASSCCTAAAQLLTCCCTIVCLLWHCTRTCQSHPSLHANTAHQHCSCLCAQEHNVLQKLKSRATSQKTPGVSVLDKNIQSSQVENPKIHVCTHCFWTSGF